MKRSLAALAAMAIVVLSGCATEYESDPWVSVVPVTTHDGRTVQCALYKNGYAGGLSCDWEGMSR